jgi:asparagine synthase (glutamine-hydrolysing)
MCGLAGVLRKQYSARPGDPGVSVGILSHRGPDHEGLDAGDGWSLGFRRLSILDLSPTGHQPMRSPDGRYVLVFNGEVFNYRELLSGIEPLAWTPRGSSDSEVLLMLLARHGALALPKLNGMFAFCFIDTKERKFLLGRDRLGVKPLYYRRTPGALAFASELKGLLAQDSIAPFTLDDTALVTYLSLNYLPNDQAIFRSVERVRPGHYLEGTLDEPEAASVRRYWTLEIDPQEGEDELSAVQLDELDALLEDATRLRLRSDVPVGVFLSGGIDSGLTAHYAAKSGGNISTYTIAFDESEYDERELAAETARHCGLPNVVIPHRPAALADIDRVFWYFDEPFGDPSSLPTFALCEAAREHGKVFLGGDGGDEAFGGYRRYIEAAKYRALSYVPDAIKGLLPSLTRRLMPLSSRHYQFLKTSLPDQGFAAYFDFIPKDPVLDLIAGPRVRPFLEEDGAAVEARWSKSRGRDLIARMQQLDYDLYLPDDILVKVDRASMANSLEVRAPFLDYRVVERAAALPRAALLRNGIGKRPLRALADRHLPSAVHLAGKRGFGVPFKSWFREPSGIEFARNRLLSPEALARGIWNREGTARIIDEHAGGRGRDFSHWIWRILALDAWARNYLDSPRFLDGPPR